MGAVLRAVGLVLVIIGFLLYQSFLFIVLLVTPAAPDDMDLTIHNFNAYQMYSREYKRATEHLERGYLIEPMKETVIRPITGKLAYRSTLDGDVCIIDVKDDLAFGNYGEGVQKYCKNGKDNGYHWAVRTCRNNTKGCNVSVKVRYDFFVNGVLESDLIIKRVR